MSNPDVTGTVVVSRNLPGPIERVWDYVTKADLLATWFAKGELGAVGSPVDFRQVEGCPYESDEPMTGQVTKSEPPNLVEYTWNEAGSPDEPSYVRFELEEVEHSVRLTIRQRGLVHNDKFMYHSGWSAHLDFLEDQLTGRDAEPMTDRYNRHKEAYLAEHPHEAQA